MEEEAEHSKREPQVTREINLINSILEELEIKKSRLSDRLNSVMTPLIPSPECENQVRETMVPLAEALQEIRDKIAGTAGYLSDLISRLEV